MIPKQCKRLAEVDFPIAEVSRQSVREKTIRVGHPSTPLLWWARHPLASSHALLLPDPADPACPPAQAEYPSPLAAPATSPSSGAFPSVSTGLAASPPLLAPEKVTLRLTGSIPPDMWNRVGLVLVPKMRVGDLTLSVDLAVRVDAAAAPALESDLRRALADLGIAAGARLDAR